LTTGASDDDLSGIANAKTAMFTERPESGLAGLAAEAAVAIDNARLTQAAQREIAERKRAEEALAHPFLTTSVRWLTRS